MGISTTSSYFVHVNINIFIKILTLTTSGAPVFFSASIREGRVALSVGHPRGTHSRYVIGCCLIPLGICGLKNNSRRITYGIGWNRVCMEDAFSVPFILSCSKALAYSKVTTIAI